MAEAPEVLIVEQRPEGHRSVPLLEEHQLGHYPEFREFLSVTFGLAADPFGAPGLLSLAGRHYELVFVGSSGLPFPAAVRVAALVPGLEPLDEQLALADLWTIALWLVDGVGGEWDAEALTRTGQIYRITPEYAA
ncbi:hypothetical protein ACFXAZ_10820 [Streptomyces sp. NPDC059477]|uniref:hypothetical protein n=1 Tax=Streptomyces sp. NPDC059477 TaxID=3346847 RepID=UPI0036D08896